MSEAELLQRIEDLEVAVSQLLSMAQDSAEKRGWPRVSPSIGYHWRKTSDEEPPREGAYLKRHPDHGPPGYEQPSVEVGWCTGLPRLAGGPDWEWAPMPLEQPILKAHLTEPYWRKTSDEEPPCAGSYLRRGDAEDWPETHKAGWDGRWFAFDDADWEWAPMPSEPGP